MARQDLPHQGHAPSLQRFGQQGMVGVMQCPLSNLKRRIKILSVDVHQLADQLGPSNRRVRIIHLDRNLVGQRVQITIVRQKATHEVLQRGRGKEELLL